MSLRAVSSLMLLLAAFPLGCKPSAETRLKDGETGDAVAAGPISAIADPSERALALATLCQAAYSKSPVDVIEATPRFGMQAKVVDSGGNRMLVFRSGADLIFAFRGTDNLQNFIDDVNFWQILPAEGRAGTDYAGVGVGARFHAGMLAAAETMQPFVSKIAGEAYAQDSNVSIYLTGHSLGGAIAQLLAWRLDREMLPAREIAVIGSPKLGNDIAVNVFEKTFQDRLKRYFLADDPIPMLPLDVFGYVRGTSEIDAVTLASAATPGTVNTPNPLRHLPPAYITSLQSALSLLKK